MSNEAPTLRPVRDLAVVAIALVLPTAITWVYFFGFDGAPARTQVTVYNIVKVIQFALPVVWVVAVQRGRVTLRPPGTQGLGLGLVFGALIAAAIFALYFGFLRSSAAMADAAPQIREKMVGFGIDSLWKFIGFGIFVSVFHALLEEYYWRWFVFGQMRRWTPLGVAIVVSSLGFMAHHVLVLGKFFGFDNPLTYLFSACIAIGGSMWAWLYHRSGSLAGPWLSHLLVDAAIHVVGYDLVGGALN